MKQQHSFAQEGGSLYLVATPIGNLEDMTWRAVRILKEADVIFAEDTRQTKKLCSHFDIHTPMNSYHEHNKQYKGEAILQALHEQKVVALVSDAGMPLVSDPGLEIVKQCVDLDIPVIPLPGANAVLPALAASGLAAQGFYFYGFLPRKKKDRLDELARLSEVGAPLIFYEAPHRLKDMLKDMSSVWGDRQASLGRELTKRFEEFTRGRISELADYAASHHIKGECSLVVEAGSGDLMKKNDWWEEYSLQSHVHYYIKEGMTSKEAIKQAAVDRDIPKREVYAAYHEIQGE
ncbi:16S rRNA (cytidine(1402)-2'-O)-methyltransferase [Sinobaca sp. H24]|uniref:16S rRNA (cytidine(1402)-2'-O)-methyltransferase n=1 Tax=Sinobaca sp. H24 TaxID=2923376 RepID=UPI00207AF3F7|nr:16S rRNA (cytidine(1402)-2'-O)-methyltransferase [Sinobaca sp. H24]